LKTGILKEEKRREGKKKRESKRKRGKEGKKLNTERTVAIRSVDFGFPLAWPCTHTDSNGGELKKKERIEGR